MRISGLAEELSASQEILLRRETEESHESVVAVVRLTGDKPSVSGTQVQHVTMNAIVSGTDQLPPEARKRNSPLETAGVDPLR